MQELGILHGMTNDAGDFIAILDFGSQYTHLIARRIRELGVYSEIFPHDTPAEALRSARGIILSGGPQSVRKSALRPDPGIFTLDIPVLGLCFGHQLLAEHFGGTLHESKEREYGEARIALGADAAGHSALLKGLKAEETVWMSHGDSVEQVPKGFTVLARTPDCPVAAMEHTKKRLYGLQFHPEVTHTENGMTILENFALRIAGAERSWSAERREKMLMEKVREDTGGRSVFLLVSGGVDSTVSFALLTTVLGKERVRGMLVDTGLMRLGEVREITKQFKELGYENVEVLNAREEFLAAVQNVHDPEEKRKRIGRLFLDVAERAREARGYVPPKWVLAQGTIYPDTIESGSTRQAEVIKTHHNRVGEAQEMIEKEELIEPIADLYKDEVRELGARLGLPDELVRRQPFPGPGLAIRIITQRTEPRPGFEETLRTTAAQINAGLAKDFALHILPIASVGVQGDQRTYAHPLALGGFLDWDSLRMISRKLLTASPEINRAVYCMNSKSNVLEEGTYVPLEVNARTVHLLQQVDAVVQDFFQAEGIAQEIWQVPVVLIAYGAGGKPSVVIRPVISREAMTVTPFPLTQKFSDGLTRAIAHSGLPVSGVFYDITDKPPGTIEWE